MKNYLKAKQGISEIVAVTLFILLCVIFIGLFQMFSNDLMSGITSQLETKNTRDDFKIYDIIGRDLYLYNNNVTINSIQIRQNGSNVCSYSYNDLITDKSTLAHWSFESLNGTTLLDLSGNGNNGTLYGGLESNEYEETSMGRFLKFDGKDDYAKIPYSSIFDTNKSFSMSIWMKTTETPYEAVYPDDLLEHSGSIIDDEGDDVLYLNTSMPEGYSATVFLDNAEGGYYLYDTSKIDNKPETDTPVYRIELWDMTNNVQVMNDTCMSDEYDSAMVYQYGWSRGCYFRVFLEKTNDYYIKLYYLKNVNLSIKYFTYDIGHRAPLALSTPSTIFKIYGTQTGNGGIYAYNTTNNGNWIYYNLLDSTRYEPALLTFTYDNNTRTIKTYTNGVFSNQLTNFEFRENIESYLTIGTKGIDTPNYYFIGSIGEVKLWDKTLTDAEIANEYNTKDDSLSSIDISSCNLEQRNKYDVTILANDNVYQKKIYYK